MKRIFLPILLFWGITTLSAQTVESRLQSTIDSIYAAHPSSVGIMVHVESTESGLSWSGASGYAKKDKRSALAADQPVLIASSIKTYVAASVLRLVEEELLSLELPIEDLVSEKTRALFTTDGYDFSAIRVKHLLSHTSGIEDYANQAYIDYKDKYPNYRWTRDEQLALAVKVGAPLAGPGEVFSYADANYLLLTEIIEGRTKLPFYEAMRKLLKYDELGLNKTWFPTLEKKPRRTKKMAHQYWGAYGWDAQNMDVSWDLYGGGGIACPTKDLAQFVYHYFNGNIV
ncbi:MAG: serine hydrolase domain-containing protein, partial [Bacteroidota bacterium]